MTDFSAFDFGNGGDLDYLTKKWDWMKGVWYITFFNFLLLAGCASELPEPVA